MKPKSNPALKPCTACGRQIAKSAAKCPQCGQTFTSIGRIVLLTICVLLILAISAMSL